MKDSIQTEIDNISYGGIIERRFGEFHESITINMPLTIRGLDNTITIVGNLPNYTILINSDKVILENINIVNSNGSSNCLLVEEGYKPVFKEVYVEGNVKGLDGEEGNWEIPRKLDLEIQPHKKCLNRFIIFSPVPAKVYIKDIDSISCNIEKIVPGFNEITLTIDELFEGILLHGKFIIETLKYKIKRKISINGNTFNSNNISEDCSNKLIWICKSFHENINIKSMGKSPLGTIGENYEFIINLSQNKWNEYDIKVENLPDGLGYSIDPSNLIIKGVPKVFGKYFVDFIFSKKHIPIGKYKVPIFLEEKPIIPLKIKELIEPIVAYENEMLSYEIKILSSNSNNVRFELMNILPESLAFNELTGKIWGKITLHGIYDIPIKISDGINSLIYSLKIKILPQNPLYLDIETQYTVFKEQSFNIPILVKDNNNLNPFVKINKLPSGIFFDSKQNELSGKLTQISNFNISIEITDIYERSIQTTLNIDCIEKSNYTITWKTKNPIEISGTKNNQFVEHIFAEVIENPKIQLIYSCSQLPEEVSLSKDGTLKGIIDGARFPLKIKAEFKNMVSEKDFIIITKPITSKIVNPGKTISDIFKKKEENISGDEAKEDKPETVIKKLNIGKLFSPESKKIDDSEPRSLQIEKENIQKFNTGKLFSFESKMENNSYSKPLQIEMENIKKPNTGKLFSSESKKIDDSEPNSIQIEKDKEVKNKINLGSAFNKIKLEKTENCGEIAELIYNIEEPAKLSFSNTTDLFQKSDDINSSYPRGNIFQDHVIPLISRNKEKMVSLEEDEVFKIKIEVKSQLLGLHRIILKVERIGINNMSPTQKLLLLLETPPEYNSRVIIAEVSPGEKIGNQIDIPIGKDIEICFKLLGETAVKAPLKITCPQGINSIEYVSNDFFDNIVETKKTIEEKPNSLSQDGNWYSYIPEDFHQVLNHISNHEVITEPALVNMLGGGSQGSRKSRRFATNIENWLIYLPFNIEIIQTQEGKTYRKVN